jgi:hypothetical protein
MVRRLDGKIHQIVKYYNCQGETCPFAIRVFNPAPRLSYGSSHFGIDVLEYVAAMYLQDRVPPEAIARHLSRIGGFSISPPAVARMCDDILVVKAAGIDVATWSILRTQGHVVLGFDGQAPRAGSPSIWAFMDHVSGRIIHTTQRDSMTAASLAALVREVEEICGVPVVGWVTDRQRVIVACHDEYFPAVPHQYCTFHFLQNLWRGLEAQDAKVFAPLRELIKGSYILTASRDATVDFGRLGHRSVRDVFAPVEADLLHMLKRPNKKLEPGRGKWLFETLGTYLTQMAGALAGGTPARVRSIAERLLDSLGAGLEAVRPDYERTVVMERHFMAIREALSAEGEGGAAGPEGVDPLFDAAWAQVVAWAPGALREALRSFQPKKTHGAAQLLGEWVRLWASYRPGLFTYRGFPVPAKTNNLLEQAFGAQKRALRQRTGTSNVYAQVYSRGEEILRLTHCSPAEIAAPILPALESVNLTVLRDEFRAGLKAESARRWNGRVPYLGWGVVGDPEGVSEEGD